MKKQILFCALFLSVNFLFAQTWESVASLPAGPADARHHPVTFSIDGYGYVMGGSVNNVPANDFMRYEAFSDTWEILPNFPGAPRGFSYGTARGNKAYVGFGGISGVAYNDLWEYDTETEEWTRLADCPCQPRYHPAFIQLNGKIYVGMGNNSANLNDWWVYDIESNSWEQKDNLPGPPRHHPFYFGIGDTPYVGFGHGNSINGVLSIYNDFYKFDVEADAWVRLNDFPGEARVAGTQFDYNGKGYILSGDGDDHSFMEEGEFWEYEPETDTWTQLTSHPGGSRWAPGNFVIDNYVYFLCGLSIFELESDMMRFQIEPGTTSTSDVITNAIDVYPNPVTDLIMINEDISQFSKILLVNSTGQIIQTVNSNRVNVESLSSGMYLLQFFKDETIYVEKVMINK